TATVTMSALPLSKVKVSSAESTLLACSSFMDISSPRGLRIAKGYGRHGAIDASCSLRPLLPWDDAHSWRRAMNGGVPEAEDASVGRHQPIPTAVRRPRERHHRA